MDLTLLALFIVTFTSILILPGPNAAFSVAQALKYGYLESIIVPIGFMAATGLHALMVFSGLGVVIQQYSIMLVLLKWVGFLYLLFLAYKTFTQAPSSLEHCPQSLSTFSMFRSALLVSLTNPKALLASVMTYPLFISAEQPYLYQAVLLTVTAMAISFLVYSLYGLMAVVFRDKLSSGNNVNKVVAGLYTSAAAVLASK